jgi:hypothetical protein
MDHRLVSGIEHALGWGGPAALGTGLARGRLADEDLPARIMTPHRLLDLIMRRHLSNPQFRMYANGEELHPSAYLNEVVNRRRQAVRQADMAAVGRHLNGGASIVLDSVDTFDPTIQVACRALGWWSGELASANLYLAVGDTPGFSLHWDDHDVICVQLAGSKSWEVRGPSRPHPMYRDAERNLEPPAEVAWSGTLEAGDVMHIPRGWWHTATRSGAGEGVSLHITFGITRRTGVAWVGYLADVARGSEVYRVDLGEPGGADGEALTSALSALAREHDPARYLSDMRAATPPARHMPFISVLGPPSAVAAVTEFTPSIAVDAGTVVVRGGGKKLTFAARAEEHLRVLLSGHPVHLDGGDLTALGMHLIGEGLCEPLTAESLSAYTGLVPVANSLSRLSNSV